ncbi:MAG: hypothetical protein V4850_24980 [Myxococcota bacterium]
MAGRRIATSWGRGLLVGCGIQAAAIGWLVVVAVAFGLLYPYLPRDAQAFVVPLALGTWIGTLLPVLFVGMLVVTLRHNARLDRAFADIGPGRALAPVARGWTGERGGRRVDAWFSKGPQLELYVEGAPRTEVGVGRGGAVQRFAVRVTDRVTVPLDEDRVAIGLDGDWTRRLVADPRARAALDGLLAEGDGALRTVHVEPDAVKFTARYFDLDRLDRDEVQRLLGLLVAFAHAVDALPASARPVAPGGLGSRLRTRRGSLASFLGITCGCTFVLILFAGTTAAIIVLATQAGG